MEGPYEDGEWAFQFSGPMRDVQEKLYDIGSSLGDSPSSAEKRLRRMIEEGGEARYAFDAYHQLAFILWYGRRDPKGALGVLKTGLSRAEELFPKGFELGKSGLPWGVLENRPFLRMYESPGSRHLELGELDAAIKVFEDIVSMNPGDNQGIRETLSSCYFARADPESVLRLCDKYEDDTTAGITYGRVLALLKLGRTGEAKKALGEALEYGENIAIEITRKKHRRLRPEDELMPVEWGSRFEAELHWMRFGRYWEETPGGIEFVGRLATGAAT
jgi:tetratricopeptide (TPR) repeat protein